jgi:hypothetical protein
MYTMNKKGLASIVAMISLILITSIATVMVSKVVFDSLREDGVFLSEGVNCLELQTAGVIEIQRACKRIDGGVELMVERKLSSLEVPYLDFTFNRDEGSSSYNCGYSCGNCELLNEGSTKRYYFEDSGVQAIAHVGSCILDNIDIVGEC